MFPRNISTWSNSWSHKNISAYNFALDIDFVNWSVIKNLINPKQSLNYEYDKSVSSLSVSMTNIYLVNTMAT